jgi:hypothetical protein
MFGERRIKWQIWVVKEVRIYVASSLHGELISQISYTCSSLFSLDCPAVPGSNSETSFSDNTDPNDNLLYALSVILITK